LNIRTFLQESLKEIIKSKCFRYSNKMQIRWDNNSIKIIF
jgi:hypothetical protein